MTTFPTIHINGTSKQMLLEDYRRAYTAVQDAIQAVQAIEFNARDYYVQGGDAFTKARDERQALYLKLIEARDELQDIAINILEQKA